MDGVITRLTSFGAFARIDDTIEGLIHISELSDRRITHPKEVVKEGQQVTLRIIKIEPEKRRMGLSLKRVPEEEYAVIDWAPDEEGGEATIGESVDTEVVQEAYEDAAAALSEEEASDEASAAEVVAEMESEAPEAVVAEESVEEVAEEVEA